MNLDILNLILMVCLINSLGFLNIKKTAKLCCGLVGFSGIDEFSPDKLSMLMYYNSIERTSKHSTGIYSPEQGLVKEVKDAKTFLKDNQFQLSTLFIGHVRAATVGNHTVKNAHPFEYDNLVGAHNGTLKNHWKMCTDNDLKMADYDVDSQVLYKILDENSKSEDFNLKALSEFEGAAALLFTDKRTPNRLYTYRNNERPLHYGMIDYDMYISSEADALKVIGCKDVTMFKPYTLFCIIDGKIHSEQYYKEYVKPVTATTTSTVTQSSINFTNQSKDATQFIVNNLEAYNKMNNSELKGKFVKALHPPVKYLGKDVLLTKNKLYFVEDYDAANNYDIVIRDDKQNLLKIVKYFFGPEAEEKPFQEWATPLGDLTYPDSYKEYQGVVLFKKDEAYKIVSKIIETRPGMMEIWSDDEKKGFVVKYSQVDPSTSYQINVKKSLLENKIVEEFNRALDEADDEAPIDNDKDEDTIIDKDKYKQQQGVESVSIDAYNLVLNTLSEAADEVMELISHTNWDELQDRMKDLNSLIQQAYNTKLIEELWTEEKEQLSR